MQLRLLGELLELLMFKILKILKMIKLGLNVKTVHCCLRDILWLIEDNLIVFKK